jgi:type VI secretion system protein ImpM
MSTPDVPGPDVSGPAVPGPDVAGTPKVAWTQNAARTQATAEAGLFGKLPSRGDFVQLGLPGSFVRPWDGWLQHTMAGSQQRVGDTWLAAFLESPVWRFALPAGMCGAGAVLGLLMPSVDRVGRYFPLTLAAVFPSGAGVPAADAAERWLEACELAGRAALDDDVPPDEVAGQVTRALPLLGAGGAAEMPRSGVWWTDGGPRVAATRLALSALPDTDQFTAMLGAGMPGAGTPGGGMWGAAASAREEA